MGGQVVTDPSSSLLTSAERKAVQFPHAGSFTPTSLSRGVFWLVSVLH